MLSALCPWAQLKQKMPIIKYWLVKVSCNDLKEINEKKTTRGCKRELWQILHLSGHPWSAWGSLPPLNYLHHINHLGLKRVLLSLHDLGYSTRSTCGVFLTPCLTSVIPWCHLSVFVLILSLTNHRIINFITARNGWDCLLPSLCTGECQ